MSKGIVVVVDDSPTVRKLAEVVLVEEGYQVYGAEDGEEGLRLSEEVCPSVILVDFIMPKINGYQFCKLARESDILKDVPVILITAKGEDVGEKFTEKFGVVDYFIKPFQPEDLVDKVNSIVQAQRTAAGDAPVAAPPEDTGGVAGIGAIEEVVDRVVHRFFYRELPFVLKRNIVDALQLGGVLKASGIILSGDFSIFSFYDIFQLIDSAKPTGKLSVFSPTLSTEIFCDRGSIVYAYTSKLTKGLLAGDLVRKRKRLSADAFNRAFRASKEKGVPLLRAFVSLGLLQEDEVVEVLRELIDDAIYSTMELENGTFYFERMALPENLSDIPIRLNPSSFILEGARRIDEKKYAAVMFQNNSMVLVRLMTDVAMEEIKLDAVELRIFSLIDGRRTIAEIISASGMEDNEVKRILYTLTKVGILKQK